MTSTAVQIEEWNRWMPAYPRPVRVCVYVHFTCIRTREHRQVCGESERERGRGFQSPCPCPRNTVQNGRQGFRSVSYIYRSTWKAASITADHRVSTVVATTNRSTIHVRYKHDPTHWTEEVSFTLYCSTRALQFRRMFPFPSNDIF